MPKSNPKSNLVIKGGIGFLALMVIGAILFRVFGIGNLADANTTRAANGTEDTPIETLRSLSTQLTEVKGKLSDSEAQRLAEQDAAASEKDAMLDKMQGDIKAANKALLDGINRRLEQFDSKYGKTNNSGNAPKAKQAPIPGGGQLRSDGRIWFSSGGVNGPVNVGGGALTLKDRLSNKLGLNNSILPAGDSKAQKDPALPVYTIPSNATLMGSTAMTAIIGRVPIGGLIRDPIPFKVITGAENLTANNIYLPEVEKAIWSGVATGDGALKCSTGRITSVTFVFRDGTILTQDSNGDEGLGWISNHQGYPCIPGTYVSNAPEVMRKLFGAGFATGAANAFSQAQTTTTTTTSGALRTTITGDAGEFALAQGFSAGFNEWARYVAERARDTFDAVVVDPGIDVAINTTEPILIDYQTNGRKVRHLASAKAPGATHPKDGGVD